MNGIFNVSLAALSLWERIESFLDTYFNPETGDYRNFNFGSGGVVSLRIIIIGIMLGFCLAAFVSVFEKRLFGTFVKTLLEEGAKTPETAMTLEELGYLKNPAIRSGLKRGATLKRWVRCAEEDEFYASLEKKREEFEGEHPDEEFVAPQFVRDCDTMHFYVPEELEHQAAVKFSTRGANIVSAVLVSIIAIILGAILSWLIPEILAFTDNFITLVR